MKHTNNKLENLTIEEFAQIFDEMNTIKNISEETAAVYDVPAVPFVFDTMDEAQDYVSDEGDEFEEEEDEECENSEDDDWDLEDDDSVTAV